MKRILVLSIICCIHTILKGQSDANLFMYVESDAQTMSLGGNGTALNGSASSVFYNSAQVGFSEKKMGIQYSCSPWQRSNYTEKKLWLHQISGFCRLNKRQGILAGVRYVQLNDILLMDEYGNSIGKLHPYGMEINMGYAIVLLKKISAGITTRYCRLGQSQNVYDKNLFATDLSLFYSHEENLSYFWQAGCQVSNIGKKSLPLKMQYGLSGGCLFENHSLMFTAGMSHMEALRGYHHLANVGVKYTYNKYLTLRCGYRSGNKSKDLYSYIALGGGVTFFNLCLDGSYKFTSSKSLNNKEWLLSLSYNL